MHWRYATARNVVGTPKFFVNDLIRDEIESSWTVDEWSNKIIEPLLKQ